jgi:cohesin complex subunit SA-1/2
MCDLINFVLKCTGCDSQVDVHDIEDPDNVTSKLTDLQDEYQRKRPTDYPLISKVKGNTSFRATMTGFFHSLISTAHAAGILYSDMAMIENIEVWVTTMSSSAIRPFRHTATVISLAIGTTLCGLATENAESIAKTMRQKEGEQKKKTVNKDRVAALQAKVGEGERKRAATESVLTDLFDTVYVHRYRDVDPKIRVDCVAALGTWITTAPDIFFGGQYLRYLGWVLSDTSAPTRAEVIKQLTKLFKNKEDVGRLRAFTERFRPRLVEMATRDAEPGIRAATVDLLDLIRDTGLLEPDDIDAIGRLVFDTEPRVRKAVAGFFAENINDLFESAVEDLGGQEGLVEALGEEVEDEYDTPRIAWLKLKCLVEVLRSYDQEDEETQAVGTESLNAPGVDSRFSLAAQAIYDGVPEVKDWEVLAGYLLYDHSSVPQDVNDTDVTFKARCQMNEREEILLLEVLNVAVKSRLTEAIDSEKDKKGKITKARKEESREIQEMTALHLAQAIPRLLKKFGASPATASAVLRLEHVLNLEIFQELRQDSTTYAALLDDINKQFMTHVDQGVLTEASTALLHARSFEDLEEVTEEKVSALWEDVIATFRELEDRKDPDVSEDLSELINTVRRMSNLASISDCVAFLDSQPPPPSEKGKASGITTVATPYALLLDLINDFCAPDSNNNTSGEADELTTAAMKTLLFYFMWLVRSLQTSLAANDFIRSLPDYTPFANTLLSVISSRPGTDPVRLAAAGTYLDLHTLFATFRHIAPSPKQTINIHSLIHPIPPEAQSALLKTFTAAEKHFAKKSRKTLSAPTDSDLSLASDPEDSDDDDDDAASDAHKAEVLHAEKTLCELSGKLVLAALGRIFDKPGEEKVRKRLVRNRTHLGGNFSQVLGFLEEKKTKKGKARGRGKKEEVLVVDDEEDQEEEEEEEGGEVEEGGEEDLRARELDGVEQPEDSPDVDAPPLDEDEEDIMGD